MSNGEAGRDDLRVRSLLGPLDRGRPTLLARWELAALARLAGLAFLSPSPRPRPLENEAGGVWWLALLYSLLVGMPAHWRHGVGGAERRPTCACLPSSEKKTMLGDFRHPT